MTKIMEEANLQTNKKTFNLDLKLIFVIIDSFYFFLYLKIIVYTFTKKT